MKEPRLRWFGHVERMTKDSPAKKATTLEVPGRRGRGRPRKRWYDCAQEDMAALNLRKEDAQQRQHWRLKIKAADPAAGGMLV